MTSNLDRMLKEYNLKLMFGPFHGEGFLVGNVIFVNENISEENIETVVLHEIGHAHNDSSIVGDYTKIPSAHCCSEHEANNFMIHEKVKEYVALGNDPDQANYVNIATSLGINDYEGVRAELLKYVVK